MKREPRESLGRKPISPEHHRYEAAKRRWLDEHPKATPAQVERAMRRIAKQAGV